MQYADMCYDCKSKFNGESSFSIDVCGIYPLNKYLIIQTETIVNEVISDTIIELVSFVKSRISPGYIYGYYFNLANQPRFDPDTLHCSSSGVHLNPGVIFTIEDNVEFYLNINCTIVDLGL